MQISTDLIVICVRGHVGFYADSQFEAVVYTDEN